MRYCEKSVREVAASNEEILRIIYENMKKTRPAKEVEYHPYTESEYIPDRYMLGIDFKDVYKEYNDGDYVYLALGYNAPYEKKMVFSLYKFSQCELYFNGKKCNGELNEAKKTFDFDVNIQEGDNIALIKVFAKDGNLLAYPTIAMPGHAPSYSYPVVEFTPFDGFKSMKGLGFSRLYKNGENSQPDMDKIDWVYPVLPEQTNIKQFDFTELCKVGKAAYVLTFFCGTMKINHSSALKIFADGKEIYCEENGNTKLTFNETTRLLFKSVKGENSWGFSAESEGNHSLPMACIDDCDDLKWVWVGPFGREEEPISHPYPPEINLTFEEPYPSIHEARVYWRFYRKNTFMTQNLQTSFFGKWYYAPMVGANALRSLADKLDIEEYYTYFMKSMNVLCNHREFTIYEFDKTGYSMFNSSCARLNNLDAIGTFGMNIAEYYLMTGDKDARRMLHVLADNIEHNIPRFPDGTYNRVKTMWTDDMYMCLPFLVRLGVIMGEEKYFDEIVRQVNGFYERMFMKDQSIYSHIFFPQENFANRVPWGRGNGWVLLALSEVLLLMPESYKGRERILEVFREFSKGVLNCRDEKEGIWHQVINNHDSYVETSGSAMFITALARGVKNGWIDDCSDVLIKAWEALTDKCVDSEGNVYGVCMGSGCNKEEKYYLDLGTITNDDHGIGIVVGAGLEIMNLIGE